MRKQLKTSQNIAYKIQWIKVPLKERLNLLKFLFMNAQSYFLTSVIFLLAFYLQDAIILQAAIPSVCLLQWLEDELSSPATALVAAAHCWLRVTAEDVLKE